MNTDMIDRHTAVMLLREDPDGICKEFEALTGTFLPNRQWSPNIFTTRILYLEKEKHFALLFNSFGSSKHHVARKITWRQVLRFIRKNYPR